MEYNGRKDALEIFNDTWKVNHHGNLPKKSQIHNNTMSTNNYNQRNGSNNQHKPIGYVSLNRNGNHNGQL